MPSLKLAAIAALLFSLCIAAPITKRESSLQGFKISQVSNPNFTGHSAKAAYHKAARKFGTSKTATSSSGSGTGDKATVAGGDGNGTTVPANPVGSGNSILEYLVPVTIGKQQFVMDFDTGSSDLWIAGPGTNGAPATYQPTGSPVSGQTWSIKYGDDTTASGDVYTDSVTVGGLTVQSQAVEVATQTSSGFFQNGTDGLLGLAFDSINQVQPTPVKTFLQNAVEQGLPNVFAADLSTNGPGSYDFGFVDNSAFTGEIAYTDVQTDQGFWMFQPDDGEQGIADTGTTLILLTQDGVTSYYGDIDIQPDDEGVYYYPCSSKLPDFSITVAGYQIIVPGSDLLYDKISDEQCVGGVQVSSTDFAIYGDILLKTQYVVFDQRNSSPQLGFAAKAGS